MDKKEETEGLSKSARSAFSNEGHAFQDAVAARTGELFKTKDSPWLFEVSEFPVWAGDQTTRIDLVLRSSDHRRFISIECKRVRPSFSWCFARYEHVRRDDDKCELSFDEVLATGRGACHARKHSAVSPDPVYHLGLAFKTRLPGEHKERGGQARQDVEKAFSQCLIGANGLVNRLGTTPSLMGEGQESVVIPAIFTTASLYALPELLSDADVGSGDLAASKQIESRDWLWAEYPQSPDILHGLNPQESEAQRRLGNTLSRLLDARFARTVAVVSTSGIEGFLEACTEI